MYKHACRGVYYTQEGAKPLYGVFAYVKSKTFKSGDVSYESQMQCNTKLRVVVAGRWNEYIQATDIIGDQNP